MSTRFLMLSCIALPITVVEADSIDLINGEKLTGRIRGMERDTVLLENTPVNGYPAATQRVRKASITRLEFNLDSDRDRLASTGGPSQINELKTAWNEMSPFLGVPNSPAAKLGLRYSLLLMEKNDMDSRSNALDIFSTIYKQAYEPTERSSAGQGKLRTLILSGKLSEANQEAESILKEDASAPSLCAEARLVVAAGYARKLRDHLEENPRWEEDERAIAERARLRDNALDSYLLAGLGSESPPELAVNGLLGALQIHSLCSDMSRATEIARDITMIYPSTSGAETAHAFLARPHSNGSKSPREATGSTVSLNPPNDIDENPSQKRQ